MDYNVSMIGNKELLVSKQHSYQYFRENNDSKMLLKCDRNLDNLIQTYKPFTNACEEVSVLTKNSGANITESSVTQSSAVCEITPCDNFNFL